MTHTATIQVALLDEDVEVWKPMRANQVADGTYLILGDNTDPDYDSLEFKPGDTVVCVERLLSSGPAMVAVRSI